MYVAHRFGERIIFCEDFTKTTWQKVEAIKRSIPSLHKYIFHNVILLKVFVL